MDQRQLQIVLKLQDEASKELRKLTSELDSAESSGTRFGGALKYVATAAVAAAAAISTAAIAGATFGIKVAAQLQTAEVGLKTLLGSSEDAASTIARLKKEAARTPFELPGLSQATQLLSSVTKDGDKSIDILLNVGEALAAMGKGQAELDRIIVNLQQVAAVGKASMIDIKQFAFAGIPIFEMLEQYFGGHATKGIIDNSAAISKNAGELSKLQGQLTVAKQRWAEFNDKTKESTKIAQEMKIQELQNKIGSLSGTLGSLQKTNGQVTSSFTSVEDAIESGQVTFELLTTMFDQANDAGGRFAGAYQNASGTFDQALSNMKDSLGIFMADLVTNTGIFQGLTNAMIVSANWLTNYRQNLTDMRETMVGWIDLIDQKTGVITLLKDVWGELVNMFEERLMPSLASLWETLQPYKPYLEALGQVIGFILVVAVKAFILVVGTLAAALIELINWSVKIADILLKVLQPVFESIAVKVKAVIDFVSDLISKFKEAFEWSSKLSLGNFVSQAGGFVANAVLGPVASMLPGRASGGPVTAGMPYMVGEEGPEMFVPRGSGNIVPNGASGGTVVNVTVNGDVSGNELVERVQQAIMQSLRMNTRLAL